MSASGVIKRINLGDEVLTYCGRCKVERTHQVVALNSSGGIERVTCRTCHSNHLYRERAAKSKTPQPRPARQAAARPAARPPGPVHAYSPAETYTKGQLISHPKFGVGEVVEARAGKVDVKFSGDLRTLLHAG